MIYRETKQKTLEEIAASFGDKVVAPGENGKDGDDGDDAGKPTSERVEVA